MQKETTSSKKIAKKARQLYRKGMRNEAIRLGRVIGNSIKPKPRWIPESWYLALVKIFVKVKK